MLGLYSLSALLSAVRCCLVFVLCVFFGFAGLRGLSALRTRRRYERRCGGWMPGGFVGGVSRGCVSGVSLGGVSRGCPVGVCRCFVSRVCRCGVSVGSLWGGAVVCTPGVSPSGLPFYAFPL